MYDDVRRRAEASPAPFAIPGAVHSQRAANPYGDEETLGPPAEQPQTRRRRVVRRPAVLRAAASAAATDDADRLLRPAAMCPRCGARPAFRVTRSVVAALAQTPPAVRIGTYQCQRRGCGAIYDLTAAAYLNAI